jgi:hypothetical protein
MVSKSLDIIDQQGILPTILRVWHFLNCKNRLKHNLVTVDIIDNIWWLGYNYSQEMQLLLAEYDSFVFRQRRTQ